MNCCTPSAKTATLDPREISTTPRWLISLPKGYPATPMERFKAIDTNGDGKISLEEARNWVRKHVGAISDKELKAAFDKLDTNKNGTIEPEEFDASLKKDGAKPKP